MLKIKNPEKNQERLKQQRLKKKEYRARKKQELSGGITTSDDPLNSSFKTRAALNRSVKKADISLPYTIELN